MPNTHIDANEGCCKGCSKTQWYPHGGAKAWSCLIYQLDWWPMCNPMSILSKASIWGSATKIDFTKNSLMRFKQPFPFLPWIFLNFMNPFYVRGSTTLRLEPLQGCSLTCRPWSHPVVLSTGPLDWESIALKFAVSILTLKLMTKLISITISLIHWWRHCIVFF